MTCVGRDYDHELRLTIAPSRCSFWRRPSRIHDVLDLSNVPLERQTIHVETSGVVQKLVLCRSTVHRLIQDSPRISEPHDGIWLVRG